jgi:hypothetical protein
LGGTAEGDRMIEKLHGLRVTPFDAAVRQSTGGNAEQLEDG